MWHNLGQNVKFLCATAVDDKLQVRRFCFFILSDGAADTLTYAQRCGIKVVMTTGDAWSTAVAIWNFTDSTKQISNYFPTSFVLLRALKSAAQAVASVSLLSNPIPI